MSSLQFQKQIRLQEMRRPMLNDDLDACGGRRIQFGSLKFNIDIRKNKMLRRVHAIAAFSAIEKMISKTLDLRSTAVTNLSP
jgi:hypothetical protein